MSRWRPALIKTAVAVVLLCRLRQPALAASGTHPSIVVLTEESAETPLWSDRFVLTLTLQLHPYGIDVQQARVPMLPAAGADQIKLASRAGEQARAIAVVWCTKGSDDPPAAVQVLDLRQPGTLLHSLAMGARAPGIERSLAVTVRTLLLAGPLELPDRPRRPKPPPPATPDAGHVVPQVKPALLPPRLRLGVRYTMNGYPIGGELRHGPDFDVSVRVWRRLEAQFSVGYRVPRQGSDGESQWSRSDVRLSVRASNAWELKKRWQILAGLQAAVNRVAAEARGLESRSERVTLWEVALGGTAEIRLGLGRRVALEVDTTVAWLPLRHSLVVHDVEVASPGSLELSLAAGIRIGFF